MFNYMNAMIHGITTRLFSATNNLTARMGAISKCILLIGLAVFSSQLEICSQDLYISKGGVGYLQDEVLTGNGYILDLALVPPTQCKVARITIPIETEYWFIEAIYNLGFTIITNTSSRVILEAEVIGTQNIELNMALSGLGELCENDLIEVSIQVEYFTSNGVSCGSSLTTNSVTIIPLYSEDYQLQVSVTNESTQCIGGFTRYKLKIPRISTIGGFNLSNVSFDTRIKGDVIDVTMPSRGPLNISNINSCEKMVQWDYSPGLKVNTEYEVYVMVKNTCPCFINDPESNFQVTITGEDPCGRLYSFSNTYNNNLSENCCSTGIPVTVDFDKWISGIITRPFCSGGCTDFNYILPFSNANNGTSLQNLEIYDEIPDGVIVTGFQIAFVSVNDQIQICYSTSLNSIEECKTFGVDFGGGVVRFSTSPPSMANIQLSQGELIETFKFKYLDTIAAWDPTLYEPLINFTVSDGITSLADNEARFSATFPQISELVTLKHPNPITPCEAEYDHILSIWNENSQEFTWTENAFPLESVKLAIVITNTGSGTYPICNIELQLPSELEFLGTNTMKYDHTIWNQNAQVTGSLPPNVIVNYDPSSYVLEINDLDIPPICDGSVLRTILEFDVRVASGTPAEALSIWARVNGGTKAWTTLYVNEHYNVQSRMYQRCGDGQMVYGTALVSPGESVDLILEMENVGNVPVSDIKFFNQRCRSGDYYFDTGDPRGSDFEILFISSPAPLDNEGFQYYYKAAVNNNNLCSESGPGGQPSSDFLIIEQNGSVDLVPGDKFQVLVSHQVISGANSYALAVDDFYWCLIRGDLGTEVEGPCDESLTMSISDESVCPEIEDCETNEEFMASITDAFQLSVSGASLNIINNSLTDNDRWYPIWNDDSQGGSGFQWGEGSYLHTYLEEGSYEVCIVVDHFQIPLNDQSVRCHCDIICQTITIE